MFQGIVRDDLGVIVAKLGPYIYINVLVEDLMELAPEWRPDFEMVVWMLDPKEVSD